MSNLNNILNERFNEYECDDIECYANIVSDTINEGIDWFPVLAIVGSFALIGGIAYLTHVMDKAEKAKIKSIIDSNFTKDEYNMAKSLIVKDRHIQHNIRAINNVRELSGVGKRLQTDDNTFNQLKNIGINFYKDNKVHKLTLDIEDRIKEILPKDLYDKYVVCDDEIYEYCGQHMFY
jgi:hypothetical protein